MRPSLRHKFFGLFIICSLAFPLEVAQSRDGRITMPSGTVLEITELEFSLESDGSPRQPGEARKSRRRVVHAVAAVFERDESEISEVGISDELFTFVVGAFADQSKSRFVTIRIEPAGPPGEGETWVEELTVAYEKSNANTWINMTTNKKVEINEQD